MSTTARVFVVFGTRPEAIKLAPVVTALRQQHVPVTVCVTAQHRHMLDQVLPVFDITPDHDLNLMRPNQDLFDVTAGALLALREVMAAERPALVIVQGDTTTTFAAALAAFYLHIDVAHVEAGLRTRNKAAPFPEEINRRLTSSLADWHFAPTEWARANLAGEGVDPARVFVTGNTGIDALLTVARSLDHGHTGATLPAAMEAEIQHRRLILVTGHRRESFGVGFEQICRALAAIVDTHPDVAVVYPVHLNPNVQEPVYRILGNRPRLVLLPPLEYVPFVALMQRAELILTDSGGIQEEAPSLRKPVLVMRDTTERPEGVDAGVARLVGTDERRITETVALLLRDRDTYARMATGANPYGDGHAAGRIGALVAQILAGHTPAPH
ncbi:MAG: UDP-N-acetylglucosamine 2-epimerase [Deltaproteobacteria bacterium]|nr:UDP-N-acetylglucosamine 2-epimerase [Deltaproteobacteria bacterium]